MASAELGSADAAEPHADDANARRFFLTKEQRRFVKFAIVGGSGVFVNLGVVALAGLLLANGPGSARIAILLGILVSIFTNFLINDTWTWGDREKRGAVHWAQRCGLFYASNGVAAGLQYVVSLSVLPLIVFQTLPFGLTNATVQPLLATCVGIAVATPLNYVVNNFFTFRDKTAGKGPR